MKSKMSLPFAVSLFLWLEYMYMMYAGVNMIIALLMYEAHNIWKKERKEIEIFILFGVQRNMSIYYIHQN